MDTETLKIIESAVDAAAGELTATQRAQIAQDIAARLQSAGIAPDAPSDVVTACWAGGCPRRVKVLGTLQRPSGASSNAHQAVIECKTLDDNLLLWLRVDQIREQGKLCRILDSLAAQ